MDYLEKLGFTSEEVADIKALYRQIYDGESLSFKRKASDLLQKQIAKTEKGKQFLNFFLQEMPSRGFVYLQH